MGGAPGGPAFVAQVLAEEERFEAYLGRLPIFKGSFPGMDHIADRLILHTGNVDRGESA
jgi:hypothetical protein